MRNFLSQVIPSGGPPSSETNLAATALNKSRRGGKPEASILSIQRTKDRSMASERGLLLLLSFIAGRDASESVADGGAGYIV